MRHGTGARRMRGGRSNNNPTSHNNHGQNNQRRGFQNKNRVFDSNGPDVRIRGTAFQIVEKYATLAKDANSAGDRVMAESYLQHAEHYQRMISEWGVEEADDNNVQGVDNSNPYERFAVPPPAGTGPQPGNEGNSSPEDLSLPASIIGTRKAPELAEA